MRVIIISLILLGVMPLVSFAITGPGAVTTLTSTPGSQITLQWLASGATNYQAASKPDSYEIRYTSDTTQFSWAAPDIMVWKSALLSNATAGYLITESVTGLKPATTYYFAIVPTYQSSTTSSGFNISTAAAGAFMLSWQSVATMAAAPYNGQTVGDFFGTGYLSAFVPNDAGASALFRNDSGVLTQTSAASGLGSNEYGAVAGDFDNNGTLDLVTAIYPSNAAKFYRNNGGVFTDSGWGAGGLFVTAAAGDYDNDGDLDIALGDSGNSLVRIYRNDNGMFTSSWVWAAADCGATTASLAFGDYDNDGDLDLAQAGTMSGYSVRLYRNDSGVLNTTAVWRNTDIGQANLVAWADYDNDGYLDLIVGNYSNSVRGYHNTGGGFGVSASWIGSTNGVYVRGMAVGDINNDGWQDVVAAFSNYGVYQFTNTAGVYNAAAVTISSGTNSINISLADFDNDGDLDLFVSSSIGPANLYRNMSVEFGNVNSGPSVPSGFGAVTQASSGTIKLTWSPSTDANTPQAGLYYNVRVSSSIANGNTIISSGIVSGIYGSPLMGNFIRPVTGIDNDGANVGFRIRPNRLTDGVTYYFAVQSINAGLKASPWSAQQKINFMQIPPGPVTCLVATPGSQILLSWIAPGDNYYAPGSTASYYEIRYTSNTSYNWSTGFSTANLWKSIRPVTGMAGTPETEMVTGLKPDTTYYFALKTVDKSGNWSDISNISTGIAAAFYGAWATADTYNINGAVAGDLNGDGYLDLVVGQQVYPARIYQNNSGTLANTNVWPTGECGTGAVLGDYDNDGDLDVVLTNNYGGTGWPYGVRLYRNDGGMPTATSVWAAASASTVYPQGAAFGDYNNDGCLDLVVTYGSPGGLRIYRNDNGVFTSTAVWSASDPGTTGVCLAFGDCDNDGDLDLAVVYSGQVSRIYRNDSGVFTQTAVWSSADAPATYTDGVVFGDYDNDGDLDLAVGGTKLYRNDLGTTGMTTNPVWSLTAPANGCAFGDFNNDGWLDLAVGYGAGPVVYRNDVGIGGSGANAMSTWWSIIENSAGVEVGDFDNDGDLDLINNNYTNSIVRLYRNGYAEFGTVNTAPATPSGSFGVVNLVSSGTIKLTWTPATDSGTGATPQAGLMYNVRFGSSSVNTLVSGVYGSPLMGNFIKPVTGLEGDGANVGFKIRPGRLQDGVSYTWAVQTIDAGLKASPWSATQNYTPQIPPGPVTCLVATPGSQILLSWVAPGDNYYAPGSTASYYEIRYTSNTSYNWSTGFSTANLWKSIRPVTGMAGRAETEIITGLKPDTTYYFALKTVDNSGNWSDVSNISTGIAAAFYYSAWANTDYTNGFSVAWGDYNNDGYPDLAYGQNSGPTKLYQNTNGSLGTTAIWTSNESAGLNGYVAWGDYDNDGDLDLFVDYTNQYVRIYRNDSGAYGQPLIVNGIPINTLQYGNDDGFALGDYDNDGDLDMVVNMAAGGNPTRIFRNDNGVFTSSAVWSSADSCGYSVAWGDYNNDGWLDLAVANNANPIRIYRNNSGVFPSNGLSVNTDNGGDTLESIAFGDYDNDGDLDLLTGTQTGGGIKIYRNDSFSFVPTAVWATAAGSYGNAVFGDFNNDGNLDVAAGGWSKPTTVFRNDTAIGSFILPAIWVSSDTTSGSGIAVADFDTDGDLDIAVSKSGVGNPARIYRNEYAEFGNINAAPSAPSGGFAVIAQASTGTIKLTWLPASDNGANATPQNGLYYNICFGSSTTPGIRSVISGAYGSPLMGNFVRPALGLDGDNTNIGFRIKPGRLVDSVTYYWAVQTIDAGLRASPWSTIQNYNPQIPPGPVTCLVATPGSQILLSWIAPGDNYYSQGSTASYYEIRYTSNTSYNWSTGFSTANLWKSIRPVTGMVGTPETEMVTGLKPDTTYYFAIKTVDKSGNWSDISNISTGMACAFFNAWANTDMTNGISVALGDYDNDGYVDLAFGQQGAATKLYRNVNGSFATTAIWSCADADSTMQAYSMAWADYDNDGDLDLFVGYKSVLGAPVRIYRNDGGAYGQALVPNGIAVNADYGISYWMALGDYDNDGDIDLVLTNGGSNMPSRIYRNDNGVFTATGVWSSTDYGRDDTIAWGDYNNDGWLDFVIQETGTPTRIYRNNNGVFPTAGAQINTDYGSDATNSICFGDFDNDGDLDFMYAGTNTPNPKIYRNDAGSYVPTAVWTAAAGSSYPSGAVFGDVNNDGMLDVVTSNSKFFRNDTLLGSVILPQAWPGANESYGASVALADFDNDGDMDIAIAYNGGNFRGARIYRCEYAEFGNINAAPNAPSGGFALLPQASSGTIKLTWLPASDNGTGATPANGLYYNVRFGSSTANGTVVTSSSIISGWYGSPLMGNFIRPALGLDGDMTNIGFRIKPAKLQDGVTYFWAVQTIDAGLRASPWSVVQSTVCLIPPGTVTSLSAVAGDQVRLSWIAPGDNYYAGQANYYEIRYSSTTPFAWANANVWKSIRPVGGTAGFAETETVTGLKPDALYYFALKTVDNAGNWSVVSNTATANAGAFYIYWTNNSNPANTQSMALGDVDNDGYLDIIAGGANAGNNLMLYKNNSGTVTTAPVWTASDAPGMSLAPALGDFDNDGNLDIACQGGAVRVYRNNGAGSFIATSVWFNTDAISGRPIWGDYDNDGDLDLMVINVNGPARLYRNDNGVLTSTGVWSNTDFVATNNGGVAGAWGDYDNDGDLDLAVANGGGTNSYLPARLYRNDNGAITQTFVWTNTDESQGGAAAVTFGDVNNDGWLDLVVGVFGASTYNSAHLYQNGSGVPFGSLPVTATWTEPGGQYSGNAFFGDYNNDGWPDLFLADLTGGSAINLYRNTNGALTGGSVWSPNATQQSGTPAIGDIDNDGDIDVAIPNYGVAARIYRNMYAEFGSSNAIPSAPTSGFAQTYNASSGTIKLAWNAAYDNSGVGSTATAQSGLYYNLRVGSSTANGTIIFASATVSGVYGSPLMGNFIRPVPGTGFIMKPGRLVDGVTYYWNVQTIDAGLAASPWSTAISSFVFSAPPGTVTSLTAAKSLQASLSWTAPGDNYYDPAKPANYYEIRYTTNTTFTWSSANVWKTVRPVGGTAGFAETEMLTGLIPESKYIFALKTVDNSGNWSVQSNTCTCVASAFSNPWSSSIGGGTGQSCIWGDFAGNGYPSFIRGGGSFQFYRNDFGTLTTGGTWGPSEGCSGNGFAVGDYDNDGDLDLVITNYTQSPTRLYQNNGGALNPTSVWSNSDWGHDAGVAFGDYDNDGDLDLAVCGDTDRVRLYRNDNGTLTQNAVWNNTDPIGGAPSLAFGDYDNDGDLDLAVANTLNNTGPTRIYRNDNGSLTTAGFWGNTDNNGGMFIAWGDYDNDGWLDLLMANYISTPARIYHNHNGPITATTASSNLGGTINTYGAAFCDYNNDGWLDVAVAAYLSGSLMIFRNDSGAINTSAVFSNGGGWINGLSVSDFDQDGDLDIATVANNNPAQLFRNMYAEAGSTDTAPSTPNAGFAMIPQVSSGTIKLLWNASTDDATASNGLYYNVRLGASTNNGTVVTSSSVISGACGSSVLGNFVRPVPNLDGDSRVAIEVKPGRLTDNVTYFWSVQAVDPSLIKSPWSAPQSFIPNIPPGTVTTLLAAKGSQMTLTWMAPGDNYYTPGNAASYYEIRYSSNLPLNWSAADTKVWKTSRPCGGAFGFAETETVTGLKPDAVYGFALITHDNAGNLSPQSNVSVSTAGPFYVSWNGPTQAALSCAWADFDNDGYPDLLSGGGAIYQFHNTNGVLAAGSSWSPNDSSGGHGIAVGDVNNDGYLDVVIANYIYQPTRLYLYNPSISALSQNSAWSGGAGNYANAVVFGDIDNDGDLDLAACFGQVNYAIQIHRNDNGTFTTTSVWGNTDNTSRIYLGLAFGDYDNDGDLDLAAANGNGADASRIYRNDNGTLTPTAVWINSDNMLAYSVAWGDFNNDGWLDLLLANNGAPGRLYKNNSGTLTSAAFWNTSSSLICANNPSAAFGDYNNDGWLDAAFATYSQAGVIIYRNDNGTMNASPVWNDPNSIAAKSLAFADYDQDGDLDIAVNQSSSPSRLYRNMYAEFGTINSTPSAPATTNLAFDGASTSTYHVYTWAAGADYGGIASTGTPTAGLMYNVAVSTFSMGNNVVSSVYGSPLMGDVMESHINASDNTQHGVKLRLKGETTYYFRVQTIDGGYKGSTWSVETSTCYTAAPGALTNLAATGAPSGGVITLTWTAPGDDGYFFNNSGGHYTVAVSSMGIIDNLTKFNAAANYAPASAWAPSAPGVTESRNVSALIAGVQYWFSILTTDVRGNVSAMPLTADVHATPLSVPTQLVFISSSMAITAGFPSSLITIEELDQFFHVVPATFSTNVTLTSSSGGGLFSLTGGIGTWSANPTFQITVGTSTVSFYYKDTALGAPIMTAHHSSWTDGTQQITVSCGAMHHFDVTHNGSVNVQDTNIVTVSARDINENLVSNYVGASSFTATNSAQLNMSSYTFTLSDSGLIYLQIHDLTMEVSTITATDVSTPTWTGTSAPLRFEGAYVYSWYNRAPSEIAKGQSLPFVLFDVRCSSNTNESQWNQLTVYTAGYYTLSDIDSVALYRDNGDAVYNLFDTWIGSATITNGANPYARINFTTQQALTPNSQLYWLVLNMSNAAVDDHSIGLYVQQTGDFGIASGRPMANNNLPIVTSTAAIISTPRSLIVSSQSTTGWFTPPPSYPQIIQGQVNAPMLKITLNTDLEHVQWLKARFINTGTCNDNDVSRITLWRDANGDHIFENAIDVLVATAAYSSHEADMSLSEYINTSPQDYFICVDVAQNAQTNVSFNVRSVDHTYFGVNSINLVSTQNFPLQSLMSTIIPTSDKLITIPNDVSPPPSVIQGTLNKGMIQLNMVMEENSAVWRGLRVDRSGSGADTDISAISVFKNNGDGVAPPGGTQNTLISAGNDTFSSGVSNIIFTAQQTLNVSTQTYFVACSFAPNAAVGNQHVLSINSTGYFSLVAPDYTSPANLPIQTSSVTITEFADTVFIVSTGIAPSNANPGTLNVGLMRINLFRGFSDAKWYNIMLTKAASFTDADISDVKIYKDMNGNGQFDATDSLISSGLDALNNGSVTINISTQTITLSTQTYFVVIDISASAPPNAVLSLGYSGNGNFTVSIPNVVQNPLPAASSNPLTINEPPSVVYVSGASMLTSQVTQGDYFVPVESFTVVADTYTAYMSSVRLNLTGSASLSDSDISNIRIYLDNGSGAFDYNHDTDVRANPAMPTTFSNKTVTVYLSTQTINSSANTYYVAFDISQTATPNASFGIIMQSNGYINLVPGGGDTVSTNNFPIVSGQAAIIPTIDTVTVSGHDVAPVSAIQTSSNVVLVTMDMQAQPFAGKTYEAVWRSITLRENGTALDTDVSAVKIYYDGENSSNQTFNPATDRLITLANKQFVGGNVLLSLVEPQIIFSTTTRRYFVTADISQAATVGATVGVACDSAAALSVDAPNFIDTNFRQFYCTPTQITDQPDTISFVATNLAAANVAQGFLNQPFLKLKASVDHDKVTLKKITVQKLGTLDDSKILNVKLYKDTNGTGIFDPATDTLVCVGQFPGSAVVTLDFSSSPQVIGVAGACYFIVLDLAASAPVDYTVGVAVFANGVVIDLASNPANQDKLAGGNFPLASNIATVRDVRTPSTPVVVTSGTMVGATAFSYIADRITFNWNSSVIEGSITGISYAVGTSSFTQDVLSWSTTTVVSPLVIAKGFILNNDYGYYVFVRAKSTVNGTDFWSDAGVSNCHVADLVQPIMSNNLTANLMSDSVVVQWSQPTIGVSGLDHFEVDERVGTSPVWYVAANTTQTSLIYSNKPENSTYYYRVRALNKAGNYSPYSNIARVVTKITSNQVISQSYNYPNPFDSRLAPVTIHYTLNDDTGINITIYDVFGNVVKKMSYPSGSLGGWRGDNEVSWDGASDKGGKVSCGIYVAIIKSDASGAGSEQRIMVGVIH